MLEDQNKFLPLARALMESYNRRIDELIQAEIVRNGLPQYCAALYKRQRLRSLKSYNERTLLRLCSELSEQLVLRQTTSAPFIDPIHNPNEYNGHNHNPNEENDDD